MRTEDAEMSRDDEDIKKRRQETGRGRKNEDIIGQKRKVFEEKTRTGTIRNIYKT